MRACVRACARACVRVCTPLYMGFAGGMWDLIALVPDHCLFFRFHTAFFFPLFIFLSFSFVFKFHPFFSFCCLFSVLNQLLQLCTARTAWSDSVNGCETSLITESDRGGPIR